MSYMPRGAFEMPIWAPHMPVKHLSLCGLDATQDAHNATRVAPDATRGAQDATRGTHDAT